MSETTLFPDFEPVAVIPEPEPVEKLSADRRRTLRQREAVGRGVHPLTRQKVSDDPAARCGNCRFRAVMPYRNRSYAKCAWVPPDWSAETYERLGPPRISHSAASDVRAWWPGCRDHEWGDPKLSPDAARSGPSET
jgi:hypothetical protein